MKYIFGNWKMYLNESESVTVAEKLSTGLSVPQGVSVAVFPNTLAFSAVREVIKKSPIALGAQNVSWVPKGAYTGASSAELFHDAGATYALVGHSERRYIFGETDEAVRKKLEACIDAGLTPVVCIGETKEDREEMEAEYRVKKQIMKLFEGLKNNHMVIVAYEPVWAIGTGEACDSSEAVRMITLIKEEIHQYYSSTVPVLYGGSVDEKNADQYLSHGIIDGVLVGSASTDPQRFITLIEHTDFSV